jgi:hypothetical protein
MNIFKHDESGSFGMIDILQTIKWHEKNEVFEMEKSKTKAI